MKGGNNMIFKGDILKCLYDSFMDGTTKGKEYKVTSVASTGFTLINDRHVERFPTESKFVKVGNK